MYYNAKQIGVRKDLKFKSLANKTQVSVQFLETNKHQIEFKYFESRIAGSVALNDTANSSERSTAVGPQGQTESKPSVSRRHYLLSVAPLPGKSLSEALFEKRFSLPLLDVLLLGFRGSLKYLIKATFPGTSS